jgi:hypothetical protein
VDFLPLQDVYGNLLAEILVAVAGRGRSLIGKPEEVGRDEERIAEAVVGSLASLASVEAIDERLGGERLREFFSSPEAREIGIALYVAHVAGPRGTLEQQLRRRFVATMSWYCGRSEGALEADAERLFDALSSAVQNVAEPLIRSPSYESLRQAFVIDFSQDVAKATARSVGLFEARRVPNFRATFEFEERYRTALDVEHGRIEPPNYEGAEAIPLERLYVEPSFFTEDHVSGRRLRRLTADEVRNRIQRLVILGNPGAGKSSFSAALCHRLAVDPAREGTHRGVVPFLVVLRDFARAKQGGHSIVQFIEERCSSTYQTPPPEHAVEYLLASGRAMVIFDGLDELLEVRDRQAIRNAVETFATLFPFTPIVVTSRIVGYPDAPLDQRRFDRAYIDDFDVAQVGEYVEKWFSLDARFTPTQRAGRVAAFLKESETVEDLRRSPLLLALMCSIYRRQNYIPRHRAEVYSECAEMLFERWDRGRQIDVDRPIEAHLTPALQHIAQWMFTDTSLHGGVTHRQLVEQARRYIEREVVDNAAEARVLAERFVGFCHGRGWVLVETGTTAGDERLYGFVHRTFLEFFTAAWFAASAASSEQLASELLPHVEGGGWDLVALLVMQLRDTSVRGSTTELLDLLLQRASAGDSQVRGRLLSVAVRTLEFLVPRPSVRRALTKAAVEHRLEMSVQRYAAAVTSRDSEQYLSRDSSGDAPFDLLAGLLAADRDIRGPIAETISETLVEHLGRAHAKSDLLRDYGELVTVDCALNLAEAIPVHHRDAFDDVVVPVRQATKSAVREAAENLSTGSTVGALLLYSAGVLGAKELLERHGLEALFLEYLHPAFPSLRARAVGDRWLAAAFFGDAEARVAEAVDGLREAGRVALRSGLPLVDEDHMGYGVSALWLRGGKRLPKAAPAPTGWDEEARFGLLVLTGVSLEALPAPLRSQATEAISQAESPALRYVGPLFAPGWRQDPATDVYADLSTERAEMLRRLTEGARLVGKGFRGRGGRGQGVRLIGHRSRREDQ